MRVASFITIKGLGGSPNGLQAKKSSLKHLGKYLVDPKREGNPLRLIAIAHLNQSDVRIQALFKS